MGLSEEDIKNCSLNTNTIANNRNNLSVQVNSSILNLIKINQLINDETEQTSNLKHSTTQSHLKDLNASIHFDNDRSLQIVNYQNGNDCTHLSLNALSPINTSESSSMDSSISTNSNQNDNFNKRGN